MKRSAEVKAHCAAHAKLHGSILQQLAELSLRRSLGVCQSDSVYQQSDDAERAEHKAAP